MQFCGEKRERKRVSEKKKHREREKSDLIESLNLERLKVGAQVAVWPSKPVFGAHNWRPPWGSPTML